MIIWKGSEDKCLWYNLRWSPGMYFEWRRKSTKTVCENNRCLDRVLNPRTPVHVESELPARSPRLCPCNRTNYFYLCFMIPLQLVFVSRVLVGTSFQNIPQKKGEFPCGTSLINTNTTGAKRMHLRGRYVGTGTGTGKAWPHCLSYEITLRACLTFRRILISESAEPLYLA
jgi:hypothetical protein